LLEICAYGTIKHSMKKVLVVEDEQLIADLLQRKLQGQGYYALVARDGEKGLEMIKKEHPDLLLLLLLPGQFPLSALS